MIDAGVEGRADAIVLAGLVNAGLLVALSMLFGSRRWISVRPDLMGWIEQRAAATGERPEVLVDRLLAAQRAVLDEAGFETAAPPS